ncbi:MaoC family dehydratase [Methylocella sp.]|uniref:MaoC family dehydratase n=1 Tax=Methylocella sp. TaxID=1978226 RepID=UPI003783E4E6
MSGRNFAVGEAFGPVDFGPVEAAHLLAYAAASGDDNPLHLDAAVAAAAGLQAPPVHGVLTMSLFEPALRGWLEPIEILRLSAKFLRPVSVGGTIRVSGRVARASAAPGEPALLRVMAHGVQADGANGDLAALGEALVRAGPRPEARAAMAL